jgi:hypothetical protein
LNHGGRLQVAIIMDTAVPGPDFDGDALAAAVAEFRRRLRRFGGLECGAASTAVAS